VKDTDAADAEKIKKALEAVGAKVEVAEIKESK
jgi:ribosomal protein L7/L12